MSTASLDIPIPVVGGWALLRVPTPITSQNVDLIAEGVAIQLAHLRRVLEAIAAASPSTETETS
jgi:hypothetical protein